jgi:cell division protein FtsL
MSQYTLTPPIRNNLYAGPSNGGRFYVRPNVYLPNSEIDLQTGMLREADRRSGRTQALRQEYHQLAGEYTHLDAIRKARESETGKRMSLKAAVTLMLAVFILFSVIVLVQQGNIIAKNSAISLLNDKITATQTVVSGIQAQIDEASDPVQICYTAAQDLDMVPSESAQAIYLTALSTRPGQDPIAMKAGNN